MEEQEQSTDIDDNQPNISSDEESISSDEGAHITTETSDHKSTTNNNIQRCSTRTTNPPTCLQITHSGKLYHSLSEKQFVNYKHQAANYLKEKEQARYAT